MRIPRVHDLTLGYCEHFGLAAAPVRDGQPEGPRPRRRPADDRGAGRPRARTSWASPVADHERGRSRIALWEEATQDLRAWLEADRDAGWEQIVREYDRYTLREFLELKGFSEGAIEMYGVMNFVEAGMNNAVIEEFREDFGKAYEDMQEIVGGIGQPAERVLPRAVRIGSGSAPRSTRSTRTPTRSRSTSRPSPAGTRSRGDYAIVTLPFSVLRQVEVMTPFSREKQRAIRQLNYSASTKILFQVSERIWETDDGIYGGATVTDLPIRRMNYPTPDPTTTRGMLLASYTWDQDAARWGAMDEETRLEEALEDVAKIHPRIREVYEVGASHAWYDDRFANGAFALFEAGQQTQLQADIVRPEGRIHFAGEHCSLYHAWIQGALESGLGAARAIHEAPAARACRGSRDGLRQRVPARRRERRPDAAPRRHLDAGQRRSRDRRPSPSAGASSRRTASGPPATARPSRGPDADWTVRVDVGGLRPDTRYVYDFEVDGERSPSRAGRGPCPDGDPASIRFGQVSCAKYNAGHFNAYARLAERARPRVRPPPRRLDLRGLADAAGEPDARARTSGGRSTRSTSAARSTTTARATPSTGATPTCRR